MAPTIQAVGTAYQSPATAATPMTVTGGTMPTHQAGDVLLMFCFFDTGATTSGQSISTPAGWDAGLFVDNTSLANGMTFHVFFKYAPNGSQTFTSPTFTGATTGTTGGTGIAQVATLRSTSGRPYPSNVDADLLYAGASTETVNATAAQNIASITGFTPSWDNTLIVVYGGKKDDWTSVATLTGDGLTWTERGEPFSTSGGDAGMVWNTAPQTTKAAITAKTFTVTGGATEKSVGRMFALREPPAVIPVGMLQTWLKADEITGLSDGAAVTTWTDRWSFNDAVQSVAAAKPTYQTNELNGKPVVRFDGTDDEMYISNLSNDVAVRTIFVAFRFLTHVTGDTLIALHDSARVDLGSTNGVARYMTNEAGGATTIGSVGIASSNPGLLGLRYNSASSLDIWRQAIVAPTNLDPNPGYASGGSTAIYLGSRMGTSAWAHVEIAEVLVYDAALTDPEVTEIMDYLRSKWQPLQLADATATSSASLALTTPNFLWPATDLYPQATGRYPNSPPVWELPLAAASTVGSASLALRGPPQLALSTASSVGSASLALRVPAVLLLTEPGGEATATLALKVPVVLLLTEPGGEATASLALKVPAGLLLTEPGGEATASLVLTAAARLSFAASAAGSASLAITAATRLPLAAGSAASSASLALTAPPRVPLAAASAASSASLALTAPALLPFGAASAASSALLALAAPTQLPLAATSATATASLVVFIPITATEIPMAPVSGAASATLALTAAAKLSLATSAASSATLALKAATVVPLAATAGSSTATLALTAAARPPLAAVTAAATASLALRAPTQLPLQVASASASATLVFTARTVIPLGAASGAVVATLILTYPRQAARPGADVAAVGWTVAPLWEKLDEELPNDADFVTGVAS